MDIDVHHGDGVQAVFYDDPGVLTLSIHETGHSLYPGTGFPKEVGKGAGEGYAVNIPLPPGVTDAQYLHAFDTLVPPIVEAYKPEVIVMQSGVDAHYLDELGHLSLTTHAYEEIIKRVKTFAHRYARDRLLLLGGGGYSYNAVVRCWTIIIAQLVGFPLPEKTPETWRQIFQNTTGNPPPDFFHDTFEPEISVGQKELIGDMTEQTIAEVKEIVFPLLGIPSR